MAKRSDEDPRKTRTPGARGGAPDTVLSSKAVSSAPRLADDHDDEDDPDVPRDRRGQAPLPEHERSFGRYTLLRRLAYGGMGEIFLARQGGQGSLSDVAKLVVIKRILGHMRSDEKHRRMFLDEARLQAVLNSPAIVTVHDMGEEDGSVYLAMEHVHGPSWRAVIDRMRQLREQIPAVFVCQMVAQAARGLSYAHNLVDGTGHALKIVHRDINPHNVLVSYDGDVKIIDFGIAKSELAAGNTEAGTIKGKFQYMSPEQSAAEPLDKRSDIFALGICLYELLTLENPFRRQNVVLSLEAIQKEQVPPLERRRRDAAPLERILKRCLAKHRADRFHDAVELAEELEAIAESGLLPQPAAPMSVWLRERFSVEIAEHLQILEATGSQAAMVARGSDPAALSRTRGSRPSSRPTPRRSPVDDPTNPDHRGPEKSLDLQIEDSETVAQAGDAVRAPIPAPVALDRAPTVLFAPRTEPDEAAGSEPTAAHVPASGDPAPLPHELTATTPPPAQLSALPRAAIAPTPAPARASGLLVAALGAVALVVVMGAVAVFLQLDPARAAAAAATWERAVAWAGVGAPAIADPIAALPSGSVADARDPLAIAAAPPDAGMASAQAAAEPDAGAASADASADAGPAVVPVDEPRPRRPARDPIPRDPIPRDPPPKEPTKEPEARALAGTLLVTTEGYLVKGNRKLAQGGSTTLRIEGGPFAVTLKVQHGEPTTVTVQSEPWAIVTVDNVGRGRTPQPVTLAPGTRVSVTLKSPGASPMTLGMQLAPP